MVFLSLLLRSSFIHGVINYNNNNNSVCLQIQRSLSYDVVMLNVIVLTTLNTSYIVPKFIVIVMIHILHYILYYKYITIYKMAI